LSSRAFGLGPQEFLLSSTGSAAPPIGNFDQPVLPISDPPTYGAVRIAIDQSFSAGKVAGFLKSVERAGMRIREFEAVLDKDLLGPGVKAEYSKLVNADQGQIREFYLASLEQVAPELRQKFFKLYAYY
jgi:hypothetical protein